MSTIQRDPVVAAIIGAAIEVHRCMGPGLLEVAYKTCLAYELAQRHLRVATEVPVPLIFKGVPMECGFRLDFLVDDGVIVEVKSVEHLTQASAFMDRHALHGEKPSTTPGTPLE